MLRRKNLHSDRLAVQSPAENSPVAAVADAFRYVQVLQVERRGRWQDGLFQVDRVGVQFLGRATHHYDQSDGNEQNGADDDGDDHDPVVGRGFHKAGGWNANKIRFELTSH